MKGWPPAAATRCGPKQTKPLARGLGGLGPRELGAVPGEITYSPAIPTPVDPAGPDRYRGGAKPCKSGPRATAGPGGRLSSTWLTYPRDEDIPGKLGVILDRCRFLEWACAERGAAPCPPHPPEDGAAPHHGSWRGNGPPSRRRVGAVRAGAPRWALRQGPRPYGAQQARNLRNAGNRDGATPSAARRGRLFPGLNSRGNKRGASLVSAAAVIPAPRVVGTFIGPKASVAGPASPPLKPTAQPWERGDTVGLGGGRGRGYSRGRGEIR